MDERHNRAKWFEGLGFGQFMKNRAKHSGINQSPCKAMFGVKAYLPSKLGKNLHSEEELQKIIENLHKETTH